MPCNSFSPLSYRSIRRLTICAAAWSVICCEILSVFNSSCISAWAYTSLNINAVNSFQSRTKFICFFIEFGIPHDGMYVFSSRRKTGWFVFDAYSMYFMCVCVSVGVWITQENLKSSSWNFLSLFMLFFCSKRKKSYCKTFYLTS